jgi:hypothetical protein
MRHKLIGRRSVRRDSICCVLLLGLGLLIQGGCSNAATSAQVPSGLEKGVYISVLVHGAGIEAEIYQIEEIHGSWVKATAVKTFVWKQGASIWMNLAAVDQMAIMKQ